MDFSTSYSRALSYDPSVPHCARACETGHRRGTDASEDTESRRELHSSCPVVYRRRYCAGTYHDSKGITGLNLLICQWHGSCNANAVAASTSRTCLGSPRDGATLAGASTSRSRARARLRISRSSRNRNCRPRRSCGHGQKHLRQRLLRSPCQHRLPFRRPKQHRCLPKRRNCKR